jgi:hypothetical protein
LKNAYVKNLIDNIIATSVSKNWDLAVREWDLVDWDEDLACSSQCVCGKEDIRYLFRIRNRNNGNELFPIGSQCIKKFGRADLYQDAVTKEKMFELMHAIEEGKRIELDSDFFSRRVMEFLFHDGAFQANTFNDNDPGKDYIFLLNMFNKRNKEDITEAQQRKIDAIILNSIKPYLRNRLENKVFKFDK